MPGSKSCPVIVVNEKRSTKVLSVYHLNFMFSFYYIFLLTVILFSLLYCNGLYQLMVLVTSFKYFKIKKTVGLDNSCGCGLLFYSLVSPILLYGSEVWGVDCKFKDSDLTQKFHLKFIKETLGVHCKASNVGCRAELNKIIYSFFQFSSSYFNL